MLNVHFVLLAALFNLIGSSSYVIQTLQSKTRPNRVTWILWTIAPMIAFAAELKQGVGIRALMTFMVGFGPLLVVIASFVNRKSVWKISKFDVICGILSVIALIAWQVTGVGNLAILFSIVADLFAATPTFIKSFTDPSSEHYGVFLMGALSATITLLTISHWTFAQWGYPLYIALTCILLVVLIKTPRKIKST